MLSNFPSNFPFHTNGTQMKHKEDSSCNNEAFSKSNETAHKIQKVKAPLSLHKIVDIELFECIDTSRCTCGH